MKPTTSTTHVKTHRPRRSQPGWLVTGAFTAMTLLAGSVQAFDLVSLDPVAVVTKPVIDIGLPQPASDCGPEVKQQVAKLLAEIDGLPQDEKLAAQAQIYDEFQGCASAGASAADDEGLMEAARRCGAGVSQLGSIFYEEMSCCGYDPQRRQFGCPVTVKQVFGFGGAPLPGSREYVLHCVQTPGGNFVPVGRDSVHLADEMFGQNPPWQFAVIANANNNLGLVYPMDGATRRARSILSWGLEPTSCDYQPIWGNALIYRIRLDQ